MFNDMASWLLALHIMAFAAWMAALWYLPRLFVYHSDEEIGSRSSELFKVMEMRLLRYIGTPAMLSTLIFGLALAQSGGYWSQGWLHIKLTSVAGLMACHMVLAKHVKLFAKDQRPRSARWYRAINEVPTILFIIIVIMVVFKPW